MNIVLYDMNASITTIFGGKAWGNIESWVKQKLDPTLNTSPTNILHKIIKIRL